MEALLNARAALLQALCEGPGHGSALAQRVRDRSGDQIRLGHGGVYAALTQLERTAALVLLHPDLRDTAREIALAYSVDLADKLNVWLADRRLQGQVDASGGSAEGEPRPGSGRRRPRGTGSGTRAR